MKQQKYKIKTLNQLMMLYMYEHSGPVLILLFGDKVNLFKLSELQCGCPAVSMVSTILVHVCSTRIYQVVVSLTTSQLSTKLYISHF